MWILRAAAKIFLTLGLARTFVAVIGVYRVRSYLVSRRTLEFGVRMAIGASPGDIRRLRPNYYMCSKIEYYRRSQFVP